MLSKKYKTRFLIFASILFNFDRIEAFLQLEFFDLKIPQIQSFSNSFLSYGRNATSENLIYTKNDY
jgi:hypothetical protein